MVAGPLHHAHEVPAGTRLRRWLARHERRWVAAWLVGWALVFGVLAVWGLGLNGFERVVERWNGRWALRLARCEELVAAGRHEEAAERLARLDAEHPAVFVKHALDRQRERVLELLGESQRALGRKGRALEAFERLVAFDPRNVHSHYVLARAAADFDEADLALEHYEAALAILPSHLPSLEGLIDLRLGASRYPEVVAAFERYLDAWLLGSVTLRCGERSVALELPVDGRPHALHVPFELEPGVSGEVCLESGGYSFRLAELALLPPIPADRPGAGAPVELPPDAWSLAEASATEDGAVAAAGPAARACRPSLALPDGAARLRATLTLYKAVPAELWAAVEQSYRNVLAYEHLEAARARVVVGGCLEAGSIFVD